MAKSCKKELEQLKEEMRKADLPLKENAQNLVFGEGNPRASIFFTGEAPGRKEDEQGKPFVGMAGRELDKLIGLAGMNREDVYITSILKYRPPDNRNPRRREIDSHTPYLLRQIEIIKPVVLVTLGNFATRFILSCSGRMKEKEVPQISECHGTLYKVDIGLHHCMVMPLHHPAAILYNRKLTEIVHNDIIKLKGLTESGSS